MKPSLMWTEDSEDLKALHGHLRSHIDEIFGSANRQTFAWVLKDENQNIGAGISGFVHWQWVYISHLWVQKTWQNHGYGQLLLNQVESWAKQNSFVGLYIDTFEIKVRDFYEKRGFTCVGQIPEFPMGSNRYFLYKKLSLIKPL